jgi:acyl dehydratase
MTKEAPFDDTLPPYEQVGYTYVTRGRTITESDILTHAGQTGDLYPLHMDAEAARKSAYRQRVAHGTLVFSIATGLKFDMTIHDRISYGYDRVRFVKPVFIGDTLRVCVAGRHRTLPHRSMRAGAFCHSFTMIRGILGAPWSARR